MGMAGGGVRAFLPGQIVLERAAQPGETYRWSKLGSGGSPAFIVDGPQPSGSTASGATTTVLTLSGIGGGDEGLYILNATATGGAERMVDSVTVYVDRTFPNILQFPQDREACLGGATSFTVGVTNPAVTYSWMRNGVQLVDGVTSVGDMVAGANTATLTVSGLTAASAGSFECIASEGGYTNYTPDAMLVVTSNVTPPTILGQPQPIAVCLGSQAYFTTDVDVTGVNIDAGFGPSFRWRKNGIPMLDGGHIEGSETEQLIINNADMSDVATYDCIVTRACAAVTSNPASLAVNSTIPAISGQPSSQSVPSGSPASFSVIASDAATYQWRKDGVNITGATAATYSIAAATSVNVGTYDCRVTNGCGLVLSAAATLAVPQSNVVYAWGWNYYGQLGDGTTTERHSPVAVPALSGVNSLATGGYHSVALLYDGTVQAWGNNALGQLGDGTTTNRVIPAAVPGLTGVARVTAGYGHSLAVLSDGTIRAWGYNSSGELGDGTTTTRNSPVTVPGLNGVTSVAGGYEHSLALLSDGTVRAWGYNNLGELGDNSTTLRYSPVTVSGLGGVRCIATGAYFSLALLSDGTTRTWGDNQAGQLGDGTTTQRNSPVLVQGLSGVTSIAGGYGHSLALLSDGTVRAWGHNLFGELGDGTTIQRNSPVAVPGLTNIVDVEATGYSSFAISADGRLWAWGENTHGELGLGDTANRMTPTEVPSPRAGYKFASISGDANGEFALATLVPAAGSHCGSADFNCDGDLGTDADIEAFFACLAGSCPAAPCAGSADFNGDGDLGTDSDIEAFFRVLGGGTCS
jgi:alpha-tubulin suppressor-like RCC1 family protein